MQHVTFISICPWYGGKLGVKAFRTRPGSVMLFNLFSLNADFANKCSICYASSIIIKKVVMDHLLDILLTSGDGAPSVLLCWAF